MELLAAHLASVDELLNHAEVVHPTVTVATGSSVAPSAVGRSDHLLTGASCTEVNSTWLRSQEREGKKSQLTYTTNFGVMKPQIRMPDLREMVGGVTVLVRIDGQQPKLLGPVEMHGEFDPCDPLLNRTSTSRYPLSQGRYRNPEVPATIDLREGRLQGFCCRTADVSSAPETREA